MAAIILVVFLDAGTTGAALDVPVLITQVPANVAAMAPVRASRDALSLRGERGRILVLFPNGERRILTAAFHSAADPAVSFDARRCLFAAKRTASDPWNIFEMSLTDYTVRQVTRDSGNCRDPSYQATLYTIVSTEPWYQVTFVSDMAGRINDNGSGIARNLYSCKLDGSEIRRLTYNLSDDIDPFLMGDGRLVYACWQRGTLQHGPLGRVVLFGVNIDGTDNALFGDVAGKRMKRMPCVTDRGLVVFIEADQFAADGSGQLSSVSFRRPLKSYRPLTSASDGYVYLNPAPYKQGRILISRRAAQAGTHGVFVMDPKTLEMREVHDDSEYDDIQAQAVLPIREPDGRSSVVDENDPHGKLYCLNIAIDDLPRDQRIPLNIVKRIRVLEGVPLSAAGAAPSADSDAASRAASPGASRIGLVPLARRRILGELDIAPDGSFNIEVPANTPIELQTLDEDGLALRTCGWIWSKNREPRGCIGCHEDGEITPENAFVEALQRKSIPLTLAPERRRTVDFRRDLMPIIERKCVGCHAEGGAPPRLDGGLDLVGDGPDRSRFNRAYLSLLVRGSVDDRATFGGRYVHSGRARTSPMIWHLFGRNTSRPWDGPAVGAPVKPIPAGQGERLTGRERRTFVEWVDMGALWDGLPESSQPGSGARATGESR